LIINDSDYNTVENWIVACNHLLQKFVESSSQ